MKEPAANPTAMKLFYVLGSTLMILAVLYFGKPVLLPISLSVLLAFILNPLVKSLERLRLGRIMSVLIASGFAFALIGLAAWALASQVQSLAADLPNHQNNIKLKIDTFKASDKSTYGRLNTMFKELFPGEKSALSRYAQTSSEEEKQGEANQQPEPVFVVRQPSGAPNSVDTASSILLPIVQPLGVSALVVVLVIFLLIRREGVRY